MVTTQSAARPIASIRFRRVVTGFMSDGRDAEDASGSQRQSSPPLCETRLVCCSIDMAITSRRVDRELPRTL
jgi:hypothetical protein